MPILIVYTFAHILDVPIILHILGVHIFMNMLGAHAFMHVLDVPTNNPSVNKMHTKIVKPMQICQPEKESKLSKVEGI